jgi:hypothetical protein
MLSNLCHAPPVDIGLCHHLTHRRNDPCFLLLDDPNNLLS